MVLPGDLGRRYGAVIRWKVGADGDCLSETAIEQGVCTVTEGRSEATPKVTLVLGDTEFPNLASGNANPITLFISRRLTVVGDLTLAARLTHYFDIPKAVVPVLGAARDDASALARGFGRGLGRGGGRGGRHDDGEQRRVRVQDGAQRGRAGRMRDHGLRVDLGHNRRAR
ncbi:SCP2 sterol-binding domain-containing protein [Streptacidiphilus neutrinimicus]|uniref:SCP2 sterol-binding domain-containing protein n=1 Tax=Streptacidiphilus neutrinimicus TaxID=105420 RepID=UPI00069341AC|nr:SCP2 sterol-binding domain-containing protein [Streptacidiphilus neutrinimicus]